MNGNSLSGLQLLWLPSQVNDFCELQVTLTNFKYQTFSETFENLIGICLFICRIYVISAFLKNSDCFQTGFPKTPPMYQWSNKLEAPPSNGEWLLYNKQGEFSGNLFGNSHR